MDKTNNPIVVTILCFVYNHELYIRQCLDGFVMQKTNFRFEVIVHDDASTDGSANIIREYEEKYPEIIKPIYEKENLYKKGGFELINKIVFSKAQGDYIALCDGDDFWTDSHKLQRQYDEMEAHPEVDMCAHSASIIEASTSKNIFTKVVSSQKCILSLKNVLLGEGAYLITNSLFYRKQLGENIPPFREFMNYDYTTQIHGAIRGGILYLPENMSTYRMSVKGGFTTTLHQSNEKQKAYVERKKKMLGIFDRDTNYKYHDVIEGCMLQYDVLSTNEQRDNIKALIKHRKGLLALPYKRAMIIMMRCISPKLMLWFSRVRIKLGAPPSGL